MIAYKFLRHGRLGPFSKFPWPEPDVWVRSGEGPEVCKRGVHACRTADLPWWIAEELWQVELDGEMIEYEHKLVAPAGRLVSRVEGWTPECAQDYADACAWRARDRAVQALRRAEYGKAAAQLESCTTLDALLGSTRQLLEEAADVRINLTIARDGAVRALSGAAPTTAYIAAHAARRLDGPTGYTAERAWQAHWLVDRLGLRRDG